ncbi:MAG TPA: type I restriction endonuclease [Williamwhitmania sp.]|nr:type I restriction endonuclease [Williamwhitmania sp.]
MDFKEQIKQLGDKISKLKDQVKTEEATKNAFVMPFIQILGYDLFNPTEVAPEFVTDFGAKNVEKVDYAILKDGQPILIIECKHHIENVEKHYTQTHKYFHLTKARFAVLTNGIQYNFYTDLDAANKMDEKPFLSFDITNMKEQQIKELAKFHKSGFDIGSILNTASELKYSNAIRSVLTSELSNPTPEFVKYFIKRVYEGNASEKVILQFTDIVKRTVDQTFTDIVSDRLMSAINQTKQATPEASVENSTTTDEEENKIITTEEELNGFYIVKSILRIKIPAERIDYKDSLNYFSVTLDDSSRKTICRLWFNSQKKKYLGLLDNENKETRFEIASLDDIYNYSTQLIERVEYLDEQK